MFAASHGQLKLVRLLVEDGRADLNMAENVSSLHKVFRSHCLHMLIEKISSIFFLFLNSVVVSIKI